MLAAFIGNKHEIEVYASIFKEALSQDKKQQIKIQGVLSSTLENTTSLAISLNVKAYLNLADILRECDVVFVCYRDAMLKSFASVLKSQRVRNKIFCCFSSGLVASDFGRGTANSYYSALFPYVCKKENDVPVFFERVGGRNKDFENIIKTCFKNSMFCDRRTYAVAYMAQRILAVHVKFCMRLSRYLYKEAGIYQPKWFDLTAMSAVREETLHPDENKLRTVNAFNFKEFAGYLRESSHPNMAKYIKFEEDMLLRDDAISGDDVRKLLKKIK